jgi:AraC-like DNA-binding protein
LHNVNSTCPSLDPRSTPLDKLQFSTRHLPEADQFDAWHEHWSTIADVCSTENRRAGFAAEQVTWDLRSIAFAQIKSPDVAFARTAQAIRADPLDHWTLTYSKAGAGRVFAGGRVLQVDAGTLTLSSLNCEMEGELSRSHALLLIIPRDFCRDIAATLDAADNSRLDNGLGRLLADYLLDLERRLPMLSSEDISGLLATTRAMVMACIEPDADRLAEAQKPIDATVLERARQAIQQNLLSPALGADELCRTLGVSRSRLYRLFEPLGGVVHYIRYRRLLDAHVALCDASDNRRVADIAAERGFYDAAEFSRAFKREFGYRPRDARGDAVLRPLRDVWSRHPGEGSAAFADLIHRLQYRPLPAPMRVNRAAATQMRA